MYNNKEELKRVVEKETSVIIEPSESCFWCGKLLADNEGNNIYHVYEEFPEAHFCNCNCIVEYMMALGYLEEGE